MEEQTPPKLTRNKAKQTPPFFPSLPRRKDTAPITIKGFSLPMFRTFMNFHMKTVTALHRIAGKNHILQICSRVFLHFYRVLKHWWSSLSFAAKTDLAQGNSDQVRVRSWRGACLKITAQFKLLQGNLMGLSGVFSIGDDETANGSNSQRTYEHLVNKSGQRKKPSRETPPFHLPDVKVSVTVTNSLNKKSLFVVQNSYKVCSCHALSNMDHVSIWIMFLNVSR